MLACSLDSYTQVKIKSSKVMNNLTDVILTLIPPRSSKKAMILSDVEADWFKHSKYGKDFIEKRRKKRKGKT